MGTVRRALEVYEEDGTTELFGRGLDKLAAGAVLSRRVTRRDRLKRDCAASNSLWSYTPAERFRVEPPSGESPPEALRDAAGTYECAESFVCELQDVRLLGEHALSLFNSGDFAVEPYRPIGEQSHTFEVRLRDTCLQLGTSRVLRELMVGESSGESESRTYDTAAHFVMRVPTNFGHWVLEYLPKIRGLWHYQEMTGRDPVVLVDPDPPDWMIDSLVLFGISSDQWVPIGGEVASVRNLVVPSTRYTHSYGYEPSPTDRQWVRNEATRRLDTSDNDSPERVYISRQRRDSRRIVNFHEVRKVLASYGVELVEMESLEFSEQVRVCASADLIVGPHGSGFANAIWARDATILELHPPNHVCVDMFFLSRECELDYDYILCEDAAEAGDGSYRLVEGDVRDAELVFELVEDAEYVYHQAAQAGVRPSVENPRKYDEINVDGTLNLLDAARDTGIERFVMASSSSVYGKPEYLPYDEVHPTTPVSTYRTSKLAAERYVCSYSEVYDLPLVALRYFTVL